MVKIFIFPAFSSGSLETDLTVFAPLPVPTNEQSILIMLISYYERASAASERVHTELRENLEYERPAGRPAVGTLFKSSYLRNGTSD